MEFLLKEELRLVWEENENVANDKVTAAETKGYRALTVNINTVFSVVVITNETLLSQASLTGEVANLGRAKEACMLTTMC